MSEATGIYNLTSPAVMAHPHLFKARAFKKNGKDQGEPKYSANFVFVPEHPDLKPLKALAIRIALAKWPGRDLKSLKFPFTDGTMLADSRSAKGKKDGEFQRGNVVIAARSKYPPGLSGIENGKITDYEDEAMRIKSAAKFYFGAEVLAQLNFVAYEGVGANPDGVNVYLNMVMSTGKGKKLSAATTAAAAFSGYVGHTSTEDPTAGQEDDSGILF